MDELKLKLLFGDKPTLDKDVWIDSYPEKRDAETMRSAYANMLAGNGLTDRYGVFVKKLRNWAGYGIFVGPHETARP